MYCFFLLVLDLSPTSNQFNPDADDAISKIEICDTLPKSSIVHSESFTEFEKAGMLYDKYIAIGSEYEINIGSAERTRLAAKFEIPEETSIFKSWTGTFAGSGSSGHIRGKGSDNPKFVRWESNQGPSEPLTFEFNPCCQTLLKLLGYSLSRFKTKPLYHKMAELL